MLPSEKFDYKSVDFSSFQGGSRQSSANQTQFQQPKVSKYRFIFLCEYNYSHIKLLISKIFLRGNFMTAKEERETSEVEKAETYIIYNYDVIIKLSSERRQILTTIGTVYRDIYCI